MAGPASGTEMTGRQMILRKCETSDEVKTVILIGQAVFVRRCFPVCYAMNPSSSSCCKSIPRSLDIPYFRPPCVYLLHNLFCPSWAQCTHTLFNTTRAFGFSI